METTTIKEGKYIKRHLSEKRAELIWALAAQEYDGGEIGAMFGLSRQRIHDIIKTMPQGWKSPWIKFTQL